MSTVPFPINRDSGKVMAMQVRLKFGSVGSGKGQFSSPHGFCLGCDEDIVVADTNNHRIQVRDPILNITFSFVQLIPLLLSYLLCLACVCLLLL